MLWGAKEEVLSGKCFSTSLLAMLEIKAQPTMAGRGGGVVTSISSSEEDWNNSCHHLWEDKMLWLKYQTL